MSSTHSATSVLRQAVLATAVLAVVPVASSAGSLTGPEISVPPVARPAPASPDLIFSLRGGAGAEPAYFGADSYVAVPDFAVEFEFFRLPGGRNLGSTDPNADHFGFAPRGSLRVIRERTAADNPELTGLRDIDLAVELGAGIGYSQRNFSAFAEARYGVIGHGSWVGELGADLVMRPNDRLTITAGPRLFMGDDSYASTYFGVTPTESLASGLAAFAPSGGALSAGIEVGATYALNDAWGVAGAVRWDRLMNDAATSPITGLGAADQFSVRIGLTRRIVLDF